MQGCPFTSLSVTAKERIPTCNHHILLQYLVNLFAFLTITKIAIFPLQSMNIFYSHKSFKNFISLNEQIRFNRIDKSKVKSKTK